MKRFYLFVFLLTCLTSTIFAEEDVCFNAGELTMDSADTFYYEYSNSNLAYYIDFSYDGLLHQRNNVNNIVATYGEAANRPGSKLSFQSDGNLTSYRTDNYQYTLNWATGTEGNPDAVFCLTTDGWVAIYANTSKQRRLWSMADDVTVNYKKIADQFYGEGSDPSITAMGDGYFLEVHELSYSHINAQVFKVDFDGVIEKVGSSVKYRDGGMEPSTVAMGDGYFLGVHGLRYDGGGDVYMQVLKASVDGTIEKIGDEVSYFEGHHTSIEAMGDGYFLMVYDGWNNDGLYGRVVKANVDGAIDPIGGAVKYDNGRGPPLTAMGDGYFLEVHQSENHADLWANVLKGASDGSITRLSNAKYGTGTDPVITAMGNGFFLETHQGVSSKERYAKVLQVGVDGSIKEIHEVNYASTGSNDCGGIYACKASIIPMGEGKFLGAHPSRPGQGTLWLNVLDFDIELNLPL